MTVIKRFIDFLRILNPEICHRNKEERPRSLLLCPEEPIGPLTSSSLQQSQLEEVRCVPYVQEILALVVKEAELLGTDGCVNVHS